MHTHLPKISGIFQKVLPLLEPHKARTLRVVVTFTYGSKRGHLLTLTGSREAHLVGPTNSETRSNHMGWSEHKNS